MKKIGILAGVLTCMFSVNAGALAQQADNQQEFLQPGQDSQSRDEESDSGFQDSAILSPSVIGSDDSGQTSTRQQAERARQSLLENSPRFSKPAEPGEFELYVRRLTGRDLPRFGADLLLPSSRNFAVPATATIPPDYRLNVGDTISISLTGSVEGSVEKEIDTNGNIFLSSVGTVHLAGVRHGDLKEHLAQAIGTQFRNFRVGVRTSELRGLRIYVTGFANNPGAYSISGLSTVTNAILQAGGPSAGGSFRSVKLIRNGREVADFDLYELLLSGNRAGDPVLEDQDVLLIPAAGPQVAVIGSVNQEAIFELRGRETLADVLKLAGGTTSLAEQNRIVIYRADANSPPGPQEIVTGALATTQAQPAEILQVLPQGSLIQPISQQSVIVRLEGEVNSPGNYYVDPNSPLDEVIHMAGGLTGRAYPFGTKLVRQSVTEQQRENFEDALDQFELTLATAPLTADSSVDSGRQQAQLAGARETLARLRETEPDGRLVLHIEPSESQLPADLLLENGDRILIPPRPTSIGVFGAVYRPASFQIGAQNLRVKDYLDRAGGPVRAADKGSIFIIRANGGVLTRKNGALNAHALPGDVVFVPVKTSKRDILSKIAQVTSILFQFGIAAATVAAID